jgi:CBS domain-containing protein
MTRAPETISGSSTVQDAAIKMRDLNVGAMPIQQDEDVVGIVTDRDIAIWVAADGKDPRTTRLADIMTKDLKTCSENADVSVAKNIMEESQLRRILVRNDVGETVGVMSLGDLALNLDSRQAGEALKEVSKPQKPA